MKLVEEHEAKAAKFKRPTTGSLDNGRFMPRTRSSAIRVVMNALGRPLYGCRVIQLVLTAKESSSLRFPACLRGCRLERPTSSGHWLAGIEGYRPLSEIIGSGGDDGISQPVSEMQRRNETRDYSRPQRLRI